MFKMCTLDLFASSRPQTEVKRDYAVCDYVDNSRLSVHIIRYRTNIGPRGTYSGVLKFIPKNSNSVSNAVRLINWALARRTSAKISYPPIVQYLDTFSDLEGMGTYANAPYPLNSASCSLNRLSISQAHEKPRAGSSRNASP